MPIWRGFKNHFIPSADNQYRPHLLHRPWLLFFVAAILATEGFLVANLVARQSDQNFLAAVVPGEVIALTNTEREQNNLNDVAEDTLLKSAAQAKAEDMAKSGYFSHNGPDGKTPWQWIAESGYKYQYAGENLAVRFIDSQDVVNAWMQSPTHRENIVKSVYTEIGVGVAQGLYQGEPATYVVQYFASPLALAAVVASTPTPTPTTTPLVEQTTPATQVAQTAPAPQVEGASVAPAVTQSNSFTEQVARLLTRAFANPQQTSAWVLGTIGTLLVVVIALTFFIHMQIQPGNMLASGTMVAALALGLLTINLRVVEGGPAPDARQAAGVIEATHPGGVFIGTKAESTGYALFPQIP